MSREQSQWCEPGGCQMIDSGWWTGNFTLSTAVFCPGVYLVLPLGISLLWLLKHHTCRGFKQQNLFFSGSGVSGMISVAVGKQLRDCLGCVL